MITQPINDEATVATIRSRRVRSKQAAYPGLTGSNLQEVSGWMRVKLLVRQSDVEIRGLEQSGMQSETAQVPPESDRIEAFTARM